MKKKTSFGFLEVLLEYDTCVVSEVLEFEREGRGHSHDQWEICHVIEGGGVIVVGDVEVEVSRGSICKIPPGTTHWMKPNPTMKTLLVYSEREG